MMREPALVLVVRAAAGKDFLNVKLFVVRHAVVILFDVALTLALFTRGIIRCY